MLSHHEGQGAARSTSQSNAGIDASGSLSMQVMDLCQHRLTPAILRSFLHFSIQVLSAGGFNLPFDDVTPPWPLFLARPTPPTRPPTDCGEP